MPERRRFVNSIHNIGPSEHRMGHPVSGNFTVQIPERHRDFSARHLMRTRPEAAWKCRLRAGHSRKEKLPGQLRNRPGSENCRGVKVATVSAFDELFFEADVVLLHLLVERRPIDAQGCCCLLAIPAVLLQSVQDDLSFRHDQSRSQ